MVSQSVLFDGTGEGTGVGVRGGEGEGPGGGGGGGGTVGGLYTFNQPTLPEILS